MKTNQQKPLRPNTFVRVRPFQEIISSLDQEGKLDGLPFMPEMAKYCGKRFMISKRIERTCEETEGSMRYIRDVVFLEDLRCDGLAHGGCQKDCMIFWKEAWLQPEEQASEFDNEQILEDQAAAQLPSRTPDGLFICQSTELIKATTPVSFSYFLSYINDIQSKTYSILQVIRILIYAFLIRVRYRLKGTEYRYLRGQQEITPVESLNLQPGEWVQVKTKEEIEETLDLQGRNRGLQFNKDMIEYCGEIYRVLKRLEMMVHEPSQKLIRMKDTVILENIICEGCRRGMCPRESYFFWREIWLKRVDPS